MLLAVVVPRPAGVRIDPAPAAAPASPTAFHTPAERLFDGFAPRFVTRRGAVDAGGREYRNNVVVIVEPVLA